MPLESSNYTLVVSVANYLFRHAESEVSYQLTKSKSQADMTVGVFKVLTYVSLQILQE